MSDVTRIILYILSAQGLKLTFDSTFSPSTGAKSGKVKAEFKQDAAAVTADFDLNAAGPLVNAAAVVAHNGKGFFFIYFNIAP